MAVARRKLNKPKVKKSFVKVGRSKTTRSTKQSKMTAQFVEQMIYSAPTIRQMQAQNPRYYALVTAENSEALVKEVQVRMNDGWSPIGGIATSPTGQLCQAVIRHG